MTEHCSFLFHHFTSRVLTTTSNASQNHTVAFCRECFHYNTGAALIKALALHYQPVSAKEKYFSNCFAPNEAHTQVSLTHVPLSSYPPLTFEYFHRAQGSVCG